MSNHQKEIILRNWREVPEESLKRMYLNDDYYTRQKFLNAGLSQELLDKWDEEKKEKIITGMVKAEKEELLKKIKNREISFHDLRQAYNNQKITLDDIKGSGFSPGIFAAIQQILTSSRSTIFKEIKDLPAMQQGRTDLIFVGLSGTGKSTMMSGLLNAAQNRGILLPDTHNQDGGLYMNQVLTDLKRNLLPEGTARGSFNYIPLSIKDKEGKNHPFNVIEVPGELYERVLRGDNINEFVNHIKNKNQKILMFCLDAMAQEGAIENLEHDQQLAYVTLLNKLRSEGIMKNVDAVYFVINKFDYLREKVYPNDNRDDGKLAADYFSGNFKNLLTNATEIRKRGKNNNPNLKIRVFPFSIGHVSFKYVLEKYNQMFSDNLLDTLLKDSFIVKRIF